jgi:hypothetical protein
MTVSVGEVEVIPDRSAARGEAATTRGAAGAGAGASPGPAELEAQVMAIIRRETARLERLWAD